MEKKFCPVCKSESLENVFNSEKQPLARYGLCKTEEESIKINRYDLEMLECSECGVIFNGKFSYENIDYRSENIQESRVFSPRIFKYMEESAENLKKKINLENELVIEVGCGEGFFLEKFKDSSKVLGFEPSVEGILAKSKGIEINSEYFNTEIDYKYVPKLIILRQVLEHLKEPRKFVEAFKKLLEKNEKIGYLYIEVPNSNTTKKEKRFYDFYYEHYLYFTTKSLQALMEECGLRVVECKEEFDKEIISILCETDKNKKSHEDTYNDAREKISAAILERLKDKKIIAGWGTAGSGSALLNICNFKTDKIKYVIDSDIRKQGKYMAGTGQLVVSPEFFSNKNIDCILILSQFHKKDISDQIRAIYGNRVEILIPEELA